LQNIKKKKSLQEKSTVCEKEEEKKGLRWG